MAQQEVEFTWKTGIGQPLYEDDHRKLGELPILGTVLDAGHHWILCNQLVRLTMKFILKDTDTHDLEVVASPRQIGPGMQRTLRINESQLLMLADRARRDTTLGGYLYKRTADNAKWQLRFFVLYQNLLFYYESEATPRPSGLIFLEGSHCDRLIATGSSAGKKRETTIDKQHCFAVTYRQDLGLRQYELQAKTESDCNTWIDNIKQASFNKILLQKEELEQKHLHLLQIVESEKTAKWQYTQQCEELTMEIKKLRTELYSLKKECRLVPTTPNNTNKRDEDSEEIKKIKKVQSFFRGWLCRRRWKQIVEEYIHSPHAESMRKRNSLVFRLVESEEEYVEQLELMVSCFLRPFKMAASSKKPPCSHDDVNSIFLNSETVMFLHQIFLKGLTSRMENWPTLVLGDLFDMLLPMLCIYQEYVRNHHYSLQVLTECKQTPQFVALLKRLEEKPALKGRTLETFLTYPMHQIPRYIITIHELLAHTPHNHVERKSLANARVNLEDLSRQMHDEVSETENIRKNLALERMIVEGCDILLDVNQVFVRQGSLIQVPSDKPKGQWNRISSFKSEKETVRQCFLFSNHLLLTTRTSGGRLHLVPSVGKIPLSDAILIEDPSETCLQEDDAESSAGSLVSGHSAATSDSGMGTSGGGHVKNDYQNLDFKLVVDVKGGPPLVVHLVAPSMQEKAAWISDISQCMDNVHFNDLLRSAINDTSSVTMPQSIKNDPKLFKDDVDIRFSRTLNSCKVPQIRYATPQRLLERLTDLRFLSIDFLNTFLLTYRVFTDGVTVLQALKRVYYNYEAPDGSTSRHNSVASLDVYPHSHDGGRLSVTSMMSYDSYDRRISTSSVASEMFLRDREHSISHDSQYSSSSSTQHWKWTYRKYEEEQREQYREHFLSARYVAPEAPCVSSSPPSTSGIAQTSSGPGPVTISITDATPSRLGQPSPLAATGSKAPMAEEEDTGKCDDQTPSPPSSRAGNYSNDSGVNQLLMPKPIVVSSSSETLTDATLSAPSSPASTVSTNTIVAAHSDDGDQRKDGASKTQEKQGGSGRSGSQQEEKKFFGVSSSDAVAAAMALVAAVASVGTESPRKDESGKKDGDKKEKEKAKEEKKKEKYKELPTARPIAQVEISTTPASPGAIVPAPEEDFPDTAALDKHRKSTSSTATNYSLLSSQNGHSPHHLGRRSVSSKRGSSDTGTTESSICSPRGSFQPTDSPQHSSKAGVVVTSSRPSQRRSSTSSAAAAFAVATAGCSNLRVQQLPPPPPRTTRFLSAGNTTEIPNRAQQKRESVMSSAATMRVLRVLRHWVSKHSQDFESDVQLKQLTVDFLEDLVCNANLLPAEHKAAAQLLRMMMMNKEDNACNRVDLDVLLSPPAIPSKESSETLSALEIAEQMTYLDHKIFIAIQSEYENIRTPYILSEVLREFLGQAWMKPNKTTRAPNILLITRRFNDVSRLVVSEIIRRPNLTNRISVIEKWAAVADICRCLHNFNGVLQICAAFTNSSVFRLKKTWDKVSKTTKQTVEKLQTLVSSDGRFRNLRDALHRCDPPCIPYLGMYLTDLSFIEEGTPNFTDDGLLNFSKMRMIAHVIREIRHFQQTPYKIEMSPKVSAVTNYLLDGSLLLPDDVLYKMSLDIEPRQSRLSTTMLHTST